MYAIVRVNTMDRERVAAAGEQLAEFAALHAQQPGFLGTVTVALDDEREVVVNVWESEEHARAGLAVMGPLVGGMLAPLMATPTELVGVGAATASEPVGEALAEVLTRRAAGVTP